MTGVGLQALEPMARTIETARNEQLRHPDRDGAKAGGPERT